MFMTENVNEIFTFHFEHQKQSESESEMTECIGRKFIFQSLPYYFNGFSKYLNYQEHYIKYNDPNHHSHDQ